MYENGKLDETKKYNTPKDTPIHPLYNRMKHTLRPYNNYLHDLGPLTKLIALFK